jgi:beta-mannosidase
LWWPNGLGDQPIYEAEITMSHEGREIDRLVVPFGIRTVERASAGAQRTDYAQKAWVFHVNGKPMSVKGTNWMPIDALGDVSPERYEWHLSMARDAGIQMIRVWGGGIIEPDVFYELCDRYGIMVWQDFPLNVAWQASQIDRNLWKNTVMWTIFRLRNHPSLVFWCGGNEFSPDDRANSDLVGTLGRYTRILDGTRPFMGASPDEGDFHGYPQWDASECWNSGLVRGPFASEWGSHGMPSAQTYREIVRAEEADAVIGPTLLKMDKKLMEERFPEIAYHWVEFQPSRLPQMLSRGSAYDDLATVPLERFTEAIAAGSAEFYKYSAEASRFGYPHNGGLLFWVWKRPWPIVGIQICDGLGQPLSVYYDVKRAYSSPWPCLVPPHLNYTPGDEVEMKTLVYSEVNHSDVEGARLAVRLIDPQLDERHVWSDWPALDVPAGPQSVAGPAVRFRVPDDFARSFFFVIIELKDAADHLLAQNVYPFRCPPQLEDEAFREEYRRGSQQGLQLSDGPWLRPQLLKVPAKLAAKVISAEKESQTRGRLVVGVENIGDRPAVMTNIHVAGRLRYVADDAFFWLEPGEQREVQLRLRLLPGESPTDLEIFARAWNCDPGCRTTATFH